MKTIFSALLIASILATLPANSKADSAEADWNEIVSRAKYNMSQLRAYAIEGNHECEQVDCNAAGQGFFMTGVGAGAIGLASARSGSSFIAVTGMMGGGFMMLGGAILMTFYPDRADGETPSQYYESKVGFAKFCAMPIGEQNDFITHHLEFANWINGQHFELLTKPHGTVADAADPRISEHEFRAAAGNAAEPAAPSSGQKQSVGNSLE